MNTPIPRIVYTVVLTANGFELAQVHEGRTGYLVSGEAFDDYPTAVDAAKARNAERGLSEAEITAVIRSACRPRRRGSSL